MITEGLIIIDNDDILQGNSQNFIGRLAPNLNSRYIWLETVILEHNFYNIGPYSDRFFFMLNTPTIHITPLTDDEYDLAMLSAELNAEFMAGGILLSTAPLPNGHIRFTNGYPFDVTLRFDLMPDLAYILGFPTVSTIIPTVGMIISPFVTTFNLFPDLFLEASGLIHAGAYMGSQVTNDIMASIPVNVPFGETIAYKQDHPRYFRINPNISSWNIRILDEKRREVKLNNSKVIVTLAFGYDKAE